MRLKALAVDYDGTLTLGETLSTAVADSLADVRRRGILLALVTGRRLDALQTITNIAAFDAVVAENGAVIEFPQTGRHVAYGHLPPRAFLDELARRGVPFATGEVVVETSADFASAVLGAIQALELPLVLAFNRSRLMVLPPGVSKSQGLLRALFERRVSIHNTVAIGDAENDHDLLDASEAGVAVGWGSAALRAIADDVVSGTDPSALPPYLEQLLAAPRIPAGRAGRRRMRLGTTFSGDPATLAIRGRNVIIAGEPGSGKSYLAGLICEQLILQRYSLAILDPEGDYCALGDLPDVTVLGGDNPPPRVREIMQALRHPGESLVIDLSRLSADEKYDYVRAVVPVLALERRVNGLPHKILVDEAHHFLSVPLAGHLLDDALGGYIWITYQVSRLHESVGATDAVIFVTKERDDAERETLGRLAGVPLAPEDMRDIPRSEAALLPSAEEAGGRVLRFRMGERLTSHVRHRQKYFDMPVPGGRAFAFTARGVVVGRAWTLRELVAEMERVGPEALRGHFERHDLSRWIRDVFRDGALAADVHRIESRTVDESDSEVAAALARVVTARYDIDAQEPAPEPAVAAVP